VKATANTLPWDELAELDIIVLLKYLLVSGYSFEQIIFIPNIFSSAEHKIVHQVSESEGMVTIYVNNFYLPLNLYSELSEEVTDEYDEILLFLFKIDSTLLRHKYKMLFIEDLNEKTDSDDLLSSRSDIFPSSPLSISDLLMEMLSEFGNVVMNVKQKKSFAEVTNNALDGSIDLENFVIGAHKEVFVKNIIADITLSDDYARMSLNDAESYIRSCVDFELPSEIIVVIILTRFPVMPFVMNSTLLGDHLYIDKLEFKL